ncbi:class I SAM-dependent methyltransferase [Roseomonas terrae]|uniref:Class I SAM-dependent methyltransferase n=1 Tax=Neoroseomonas terrae TaxID=424799 RepID=A0ABS5EC24_9PROT|nr:class I SAM-dependent methyltransferase [Neoroseomonas terrae]
MQLSGYDVISDKFPDRYVLDLPRDANAIALQRGGWKFSYETKSEAEIRESIASDGRPLFCSMFFPNFADSDYRVLELGPSDGYNTAGLEFHGASNILSIESNVDAFQRCLILKNVFGLKAKFLLGDFLKYLHADIEAPDLIYASGVLYHLTDPVAFLRRCGEVSPDLFLWTFVHDEEAIRAHEYETRLFVPQDDETVHIFGRAITCHRRYYDAELVQDRKFAGGVRAYANWLSRPDLLAVLEGLGYRVLRMIDDGYSGLPAVNIFATRRPA